MTTEQYQVGYEEGYADGFEAGCASVPHTITVPRETWDALREALTPELVRQWGELKTAPMGNGDSHEVVVITLARLRHLFDAALTAANAVQPTCKHGLQVETEQERYVRLCPDIECGRKKHCTRMIGISCMSRADIADSANAVEQRCQLCKYEHGHSIGCENNPVDISLAANAVSAQPKPVALQWVAEMIMSDCGCSTNNERLLERIIGRIEQYERANGPARPQATEPAWRPIETAPKDGSKIIVTYLNRNGLKRTVMARWLTAERAAETDADDVGLEEGWYECIDNWNDYTEVALHQGEPTHWMPIPAAPEQKP